MSNAVPQPQWVSADAGVAVAQDCPPQASVPAAGNPERPAASSIQALQQVDWLDEHHHIVHSLLMQRGYVPIYPQLVDAAGSMKAALMLGQAIALSRTWLRKEPSKNGWFWASAADWQQATGLTAREQESARMAIVEAGLWEERRVYNPSRLYFRVDLVVLATALGLAPSTPWRQTDAAEGAPIDTWRWDEQVASRLLGQPHVFFKPLADLAGGVMAGLLLSSLLAAQRSALQGRAVDAHGRFVVRYDAVATALQLGEKVVRNAREQLRRAGFVTEQRLHAGPATQVRIGINMTAVLACLTSQPPSATGERIAASQARQTRKKAENLRAIIRATGAQPTGGGAATIAGFQQFSGATADPQLSLTEGQATEDQALAATSSIAGEQGGLGVGALLSIANSAPVDKVGVVLSVAKPSRCRFVESDGAVLSVAYTEPLDRTIPPPPSPSSLENIPEWRRRAAQAETAEGQWPITQTEPAAALGVDEQAFEDGLVTPTGIERAQALRIVRAAPLERRQEILDELAGQMRNTRRDIDSPASYLRRLVRKALDGTLVTVVAEEEAQRRAAKARHAARVQAAAGQGSDGSRGNTGAPVDAETLSKLKAFRSQLAMGRLAAAPVEPAQGGSDDF